MKKFFLSLSLLFSLLVVPLVFADADLVVLYDQTLSLPGCSLGGSNSCAVLDGTGNSELRKTIRLQRFVPASGYVSVYFRNQGAPSTATFGGFTMDNVYFERLSGERVPLQQGLQVFERGNVVMEFDQPYTSSEREEIDYEFVVYYLPHSDAEKQHILFLIQDDDQNFGSYKDQNKRNITALCTALQGQSRVPTGCGGSSGSSPDTSSGPRDPLTSDPDSLPELDFSGVASRPPVVVMRDIERLTFVGQPVTIILNDVFDPDGQCGFFEFQWKKPRRMQVVNVSVDPRLGDLSFTPQNVGSFSIRLRVKEVCGGGLGDLTSAPYTVRVVVNDKSVDFQDLRSSRYQNAIYDLYHLGVMKGYPDGTMRPHAAINRAEFLKLIFETLKYQIPDNVYSPRYPDVLPSDWFSKYVHQADQLGVIKGYPNGRFHPERTVNLVEALKMSMHFADIEVRDSLDFIFGDVDYRDWYSRYVQTAYRTGILDDIEPGANVFPGQALTRGKAAQIIVRTFLFPVNRINQVNQNVQRRPDEYQDFSSFTYAQ